MQTKLNPMLSVEDIRIRLALARTMTAEDVVFLLGELDYAEEQLDYAEEQVLRAERNATDAEDARDSARDEVEGLQATVDDLRAQLKAPEKSGVPS